MKTENSQCVWRNNNLTKILRGSAGTGLDRPSGAVKLRLIEVRASTPSSSSSPSVCGGDMDSGSSCDDTEKQLMVGNEDYWREDVRHLPLVQYATVWTTWWACRRWTPPRWRQGGNPSARSAEEPGDTRVIHSSMTFVLVYMFTDCGTRHCRTLSCMTFWS